MQCGVVLTVLPIINFLYKYINCVMQCNTYICLFDLTQSYLFVTLNKYMSVLKCLLCMCCIGSLWDFPRYLMNWSLILDVFGIISDSFFPGCRCTDYGWFFDYLTIFVRCCSCTVLGCSYVVLDCFYIVLG